MNIDEWDNIVGIVTAIWFVWFVIEITSIDYDVLCIWILEETVLCLQEPIFQVDDGFKEWSEKISLVILGFFVMDLGYRAGKQGWNKSLRSWQYWLDVAITFPFFWVIEPWAFMRTLRIIKVVKVFKLVMKMVKAYKKINRVK
jgi:hypothetical protein